MNYVNTFIQVADDCPVSWSVIPVERGGRKTVAVLQFALISSHPYRYTQEDVLFEVYIRQQAILPSQLKQQRAQMRQDYFSTPKACLRTSPLPKKYGWGLHFDEHGTVALCPMESEAYGRFTAAGSNGPMLVKALRSSRT